MELVGSVLDVVGLQVAEWLWQFNLTRNILIGAALGVWVALLLYVALSHAQRIIEEGTELGTFWSVVLKPAVVVFYVLDFGINVILATLVFAELPRLAEKEWLLTARLQRLVNEPNSWRRRIAVWFSRKLNFFDEHIEIPEDET